MENGKIRLIPVKTGIDGDVMVEVIPADSSQLEEGMQVVAGGGAGLTDGQAVTALPQSQEASS